jgi:hypothetical protein
MKNKTKLTCIFAALILGAVSINAADKVGSFTGIVGTKYASDYHRRGDVLSAEAIQAQVGFSTNLSGVEVFGDFFTNQSTSSNGANTDEATIGLGTALFGDRLSAYLGVYNTDNSAEADSSLEGFLSVSVNTLLEPTLSFYQDTDESLRTFEGQLSYDVDIDVASLGLSGVLGSTDTMTSKNQTYTALTATISRDIKDEFSVYADLSLSDADDRTNETTWGIGLSMNF